MPKTTFPHPILCRRETPATDPYARRCAIDGAIRNLQLARDALVRAGAPRTLARVRAALRSAEGAKRNAEGREGRLDRATATAIDAMTLTEGTR